MDPLDKERFECGIKILELAAKELVKQPSLKLGQLLINIGVVLEANDGPYWVDEFNLETKELLVRVEETLAKE
jgi:hypothetical protein